VKKTEHWENVHVKIHPKSRKKKVNKIFIILLNNNKKMALVAPVLKALPAYTSFCDIPSDRFIAVSNALNEQLTFKSKLTPGVRTAILWVVISAAYWGVAGWLIHRDFPISDDPDKSAKRSQIICIAMIVYSVLNILLIIFYGFQVRHFESLNWSALNPGQTYGGEYPLLTWGLMGLFGFGGLFVSVILLCHYSGNSLHVGLIVVLCLLALILSFTVAVVGKTLINCTKPLFTDAEKTCVDTFHSAVDAVNQENLTLLQTAGQTAGKTLEGRQGMSELDKSRAALSRSASGEGAAAISRSQAAATTAAATSRAAEASRSRAASDLLAAMASSRGP
jgi:hypothetical protein